jgi:hypothetical protein
MARAGLLEGWHRLDPQDGGIKTSGIIDALATDTMGLLSSVRDALDVLCPQLKRGGAYNPSALGRTLKGLTGRVVGVDGVQMRLMSRPSGKLKVWYVEALKN